MCLYYLSLGFNFGYSSSMQKVRKWLNWDKLRAQRDQFEEEHGVQQGCSPAAPHHKEWSSRHDTYPAWRIIHKIGFQLLKMKLQVFPLQNSFAEKTHQSGWSSGLRVATECFFPQALKRQQKFKETPFFLIYSISQLQVVPHSKHRSLLKQDPQRKAQKIPSVIYTSIS